MAHKSLNYHIKTKDERFVREGEEVYRLGQVWREQVNPASGDCVARILLRESHARVMYNTAKLEIVAE